MAVAPLNLPGYATPQSIDFSSLANLGQVYKKSSDDARRQATLAQLGQGENIDPRVLLASGDLSLANLGLQIQGQQASGAKDSRDFAFRQEEAKRAQANADRAYKLQAAANARAGEDKPLIKEVTDPNTGATSFVRINPRTGELSPLGNPVAPSQPNNPYASSGPKLNADQSKAATMTDRMADANSTITKNEDINNWDSKKGGYLEGVAASIPFVRDSTLFNTVATPDRQKTVQAQRNFVNAILRLESGAAVSESEFNNAQRQYFPQPGDSKEVLAQKRQNRVIAMQGMARQAGPGYKPPTSLTGANPSAGSVTSSGVKWSVE